MVPQNCYVNRQELEQFPLGIRIDYVLYKVRRLPATCLQPLSLFMAYQPLLILCLTSLVAISGGWRMG